MAEFDRSKFKGTQIASIKKVNDDAKKQSKNFNQGGGDYVGFFNIEEGINYLRVAPAHNTEDTPYQPVRTAMLKCKVEKRNADGEIIEGEFEIKNKKIFISTFHCEKDENGKPIIYKDIIETYIGYIIRQAENLHGKGSEDFKRYLNPVNGYMTGGKWNFGIKPSTEFVCYGWDSDKELVRAGLFESWMKKMNEISLKESGDDVLALDVFSDPDTGFPLSITKRKNDKNKWEYIIDAERMSRTDKSWDDFFKRNNPTDEMLMRFSEVKSLKESYVGVYTSRDFGFAIDGLKRFDEENGFNIFANDEFLDEVEEIAALVPEYKKPDDSEKEEKSEPKKPVTASKPEPKQEVKEVTPLQMKKFLREYIQENYGDDQQLPTSIKGDELKEWYELAQAGEELPFSEPENTEEDTQEEQQEEPSETQTEEKPTSNPSVNDRLAMLKARREQQQQGK